MFILYIHTYTVCCILYVCGKRILQILRRIFEFPPPIWYYYISVEFPDLLWNFTPDEIEIESCRIHWPSERRVNEYIKIIECLTVLSYRYKPENETKRERMREREGKQISSTIEGYAGKILLKVVLLRLADVD